MGLQTWGFPIHTVQISESPETYLTCFISDKGQGGWEVVWLGLVKLREDLMLVDEGCHGHFLDQSQISDEKILSLWTRSKTSIF